jgi:hypothetical protein
MWVQLASAPLMLSSPLPGLGFVAAAPAVLLSGPVGLPLTAAFLLSAAAATGAATSAPGAAGGCITSALLHICAPAQAHAGHNTCEAHGVRRTAAKYRQITGSEAAQL